MQLDPLEFQVQTEQLDAAITKLGTLQTAVQKLSKDTSSQSDLQVAKETNKVLIENAKAQASLIAIETKRIESQKKLQKAQEETGKASEASGEKSKDKIEEIITKLQLLEKYMGQGFTRGFAGTMSQVEMLGGATAVQMEKITTAMTDLGKHMRNPFDDAIGPIQSINRELEKVHSRGRLAAEGIELTKKQLDEFSRITSSIESQQKSRGLNLLDASSITETTALIKKAQDDYVAKAREFNSSIQKETVIGKAIPATEGNAATALFIKDQENKVKALARAEEMLARLDNKIKQSTAETPLAQSAANQLFTYTKMLEKAGVAADVAKVKIEEFSKKQHAASALALVDEEKKIKHLAASLAPQVTDVTVGLMTGQNPLTVFMQQGGQIRDQIGLSRVATEDLGKVFKMTITGMIDMVMAMGAAMIKFMFTPLGIVLSAVAALATTVAFLSGEMLKSEKQTVEITKALVGSGNAAGATADQMKEMAREASNASGISFDKSVGAMIEFAKTGEMTKEEFVQAAEAALLYERYMGVAVSESAKQLKELAKDPLKAVMKINEETGYFTDAIVRQVAELERLGLKEEAATLAKAEYSKATKQAAEEVRASMGYMLKFFDDIGLAATWMWDKITGVGAVQGIDKKIAAAVADVQSLAGAQAGQQGKGIFAIDFSSDIETAVSDLNALLKIQETANSKAEAQQKARGLSKDQADIEALTNKHMLKADTKVEERAKAVQLYIGLINDAASKGDAELQATIARRDKLLHDIDTGKKGDPKAKADTLSSLNLNLDNQTQQDEKQYQLKLRGIDNFTKQEQTRLQNSLTAKEITQGEFMVRELAMIAEGEQKKTNITSAQREIAAANVARDATTLTTSYNAWIDANKGTAGFADKNKDELEKVRSKVADLGRAYETATVAMDEQDKKAKELSKTLYEKQYAVMAGAIRSAKEELVKFGIAEEKLTQQRKAQVEVEDKLRYATPEQAAYIQAEAAETARLTSEVQKYNEELRLQAENVDGANAAKEEEIRLNGFLSLKTKELVDLQQDLYNQKLKNRDVIAGGIDIAGVTAGTAAVVKLQKDKLKELSDGVANSIEIGLFEGGEAGAKSLRNLVEAELRKPITIFIKAVVGSLTGAVGNFMSGGSGTTTVGGGLLSGLSTANTAYGVYSNGVSGTVGSSVGSLFGNTAGNTALGMTQGLGYTSSSLAANSAATAGTNYAAIQAGGTASTGAAAGTAATGTLSTAIPYIGAFIAAVMILQQMGPTSARSLGNASVNYDASGNLITAKPITEQATAAVLPTDTSDWQLNIRNREQNRANMAQADTSLNQFTQASEQAKTLAASYYETAKALDIKTLAATFGFNTNTGKGGANPNLDFRVNAGGVDYSTGEISATDQAAVDLGFGRTIVTALKASELPKYIAGVFDELTVGTATQKQLDDVLVLAQQYKAFHDTLVALPFENLKDMSYQTAKALTEAAGGMEAFGAKLESYYSNYYTAEEQKAQTIKNINTTLIGTGFDAATATKDTFRKLVESQDVTTESGRKTYLALMNVSEAFAGITPVIESTVSALEKVNQTWQDKLDVLTGDRTSLQVTRQNELASATDKSTTALMHLVYAQEDLKAASEAAKAALNTSAALYFNDISRNKASASLLSDASAGVNKFLGIAKTTEGTFDKQIATAQASSASASTALSSWSSLASSIKGILSSVTSKTNSLLNKSFTEFFNEFTALNTLAKTGDKTAAGNLVDVATAALSATESQSSTLVQYMTERSKISSGLDETLKIAESSMSVQESILAASNSVVTELQSINGALSGFAADVYEMLSKGYAGTTKEVANVAVDKLVQMTSDAAKFFQTYKEGETFTGNGFSATRLAGGYGQMNFDSGGSTFINESESILDAAKRSPELRALWEKQYGINLPSFDIGTNYVPNDMLANIHEGERILPKADNLELMNHLRVSGEQDNSSLLAALIAVREELKSLKELQTINNTDTRKATDTLIRVTLGGEAMQTQTAV